MRGIAIAGILWAACIGRRQPRSVAVAVSRHARSASGDRLSRRAQLTDPITALQRNLTAGSASLEFEGRLGFLRSLLTTLNVPVESQILLFSKTGIQHPFTNPENPRALYFNDRVVVGYIPGAPMLSIGVARSPPGRHLSDAAAGRRRGGVFLRPYRRLTVDLSANSLGVPGILVRSMFTEANRPHPTATGERHRRSPHAARATVGRPGTSPAHTARRGTWATRW